MERAEEKRAKKRRQQARDAQIISAPTEDTGATGRDLGWAVNKLEIKSDD